MLFLVLLRDGLLLEWVNMFMLCHIDEHFATSLSIFGFDNEACFWLYDSATFCVNEWLAIW